MRNLTPPKKQSPEDWHPAQIVCALRMAGWSLRQLSLHHGYANASTLKRAIQKPWPKGERLIAAAINTPPEAIWPSRYAARAERAARKIKSTRRGREGNGKNQAAT
jgi:Ner family transcriptional regulator